MFRPESSLFYSTFVVGYRERALLCKQEWVTHGVLFYEERATVKIKKAKLTANVRGGQLLSNKLPQGGYYINSVY